MTTFDSNPTAMQFLAWKIGERVKAKERAGTRTHTWVQTLVRFVLQVSALSCLTWAGFTVSMTLGLVVAGLSFFLLSFLLTTSSPTSPQKTDPMLAQRR